jgi:hypothetical protein
LAYTLGEAARATGKSKAAISRAIKNHVLSAEKQSDGFTESIHLSCTGFIRQSVLTR